MVTEMAYSSDVARIGRSGGSLEFAFFLRSQLPSSKVIDVVEVEEIETLKHPGKLHHVVVKFGGDYHDLEGTYSASELLSYWKSKGSGMRFKLEDHDPERAIEQGVKRTTRFSKQSSVLAQVRAREIRAIKRGETGYSTFSEMVDKKLDGEDVFDGLLESSWQSRLKSKRHKNTGTEVDQEQERLYACGDCVYFALALGKMFPDYELAMLWDEDPDSDDQLFIHAFAMDKGKAIDVRGVHTSWRNMASHIDYRFHSSSIKYVTDKEMWQEWKSLGGWVNREYIRLAMQLIADNRVRFTA